VPVASRLRLPKVAARGALEKEFGSLIARGLTATATKGDGPLGLKRRVLGGVPVVRSLTATATKGDDPSGLKRGRRVARRPTVAPSNVRGNKGEGGVYESPPSRLCVSAPSCLIILPKPCKICPRRAYLTVAGSDPRRSRRSPVE
jgi:hypothetical protein